MVTHICSPGTGVEELRQEDCCKFKDSLSYSLKRIERWLLFTKTPRSVLLIAPIPGTQGWLSLPSVIPSADTEGWISPQP